MTGLFTYGSVLLTWICSGYDTTLPKKEKTKVLQSTKPLSLWGFRNENKAIYLLPIALQ